MSVDEISALVDRANFHGAWLKQWGKAQFVKHAALLLDKGYSPEEVESILKNLHEAVAEQYGDYPVAPEEDS